MGVEKSRGQLIVDRIKNGPPIKLHKMEELDYIFNPFIERIKGEVIKSIVEKNLTSASFTCTNLCRELRIDYIRHFMCGKLSNYLVTTNCLRRYKKVWLQRFYQLFNTYQNKNLQTETVHDHFKKG